jgi:dihydroflavonol-4-reductase
MTFVTGATGLVGSYLVRYLLQRGDTVRALRRTGSDLSLLGADADKVEWVEGDVLDLISLEDAMQGVDKVYHAAAFISFRRSEQQRMIKINAEGTANVVNTALHLGLKKLLHFSSVTAISKGKPGVILTEADEFVDSDADSIYGLSKYLAEMEVWRGMLEGLDAVIVNPSLIIGAGRWDDSSLKIFKRVHEGISFYPKGSNGYVDVRDVAKTAIALMESDIINERFIINAENLSYQEVMGSIAEHMHLKKPTIPISSLMTTVASLAEGIRSAITGKEPIITREIARLTAADYRYSNEKIKEKLDYEFIPISRSLEEIVVKYQESVTAKKDYAILAL